MVREYFVPQLLLPDLLTCLYCVVMPPLYSEGGKLAVQPYSTTPPYTTTASRPPDCTIAHKTSGYHGRIDPPTLELYKTHTDLPLTVQTYKQYQTWQLSWEAFSACMILLGQIMAGMSELGERDDRRQVLLRQQCDANPLRI